MTKFIGIEKLFLSNIIKKYKCLWGVRGKDWGSSFQERVSHTHTLRLCYSINFILYKKKIIGKHLHITKFTCKGSKMEG